MTAQIATVFRIVTVGLDHHGHGVPTHVRAKPFFDFDVARAMDFLIGLDGVHIARVGGKRQVNAVLAGVF